MLIKPRTEWQLYQNTEDSEDMVFVNRRHNTGVLLPSKIKISLGQVEYKTLDQYYVERDKYAYPEIKEPDLAAATFRAFSSDGRAVDS